MDYHERGPAREGERKPAANMQIAIGERAKRRLPPTPGRAASRSAPHPPPRAIGTGGFNPVGSALGSGPTDERLPGELRTRLGTTRASDLSVSYALFPASRDEQLPGRLHTRPPERSGRAASTQSALHSARDLQTSSSVLDLQAGGFSDGPARSAGIESARF